MLEQCIATLECGDAEGTRVDVQQIGDEQRGWAWTRALQGVPANEIHLCGDGSALPLVRRLAAEMNEPLEVRCMRACVESCMDG